MGSLGLRYKNTNLQVPISCTINTTYMKVETNKKHACRVGYVNIIVNNMSKERNPLVVSGVVGDVLDPFTATTELRVHSDGKVVSNGCNFRPSHVAGRPRVEIGGDDFRTLYTLVMVDADAPSPSNPQFKEYLHWMVTDIPGSTGVRFGKEIVSYEAPQPSMGIHRIVLVLFRQAGRQTVTAPRRRVNFNTREFSLLYNLGSPVAAVYYNCQRESGTGGRRA